MSEEEEQVNRFTGSHAEFTCRLHNIRFGSNAKESWINECPVCNKAQLDRLRASVETLTHQRNALLKAIEIKQTVDPVTALKTEN